MKVAMGGDDSNSETDDEEQLTQRKSTSSSSGKASRQAMESARRFLWDDDEEAVDVNLASSSKIDLSGTQSLFSSKEYSTSDQINLSAYSQAYKGTGSNLSPYSQASNSFKGGRGSAEMYLKRKSLERSNSRTFSSKCFTCWSLFLALSCFAGWIVGTKMLFQDEVQEVATSQVDLEDEGERFVTISQALNSMVELPAGSFSTKGTAQYEALRWLADEDPLDLSPDDAELLMRYVLAVFFFSTDGQTDGEGVATSLWKNQNSWMTKTSACNWYGITCASEGVLLKLSLPSNGISGTIPQELGFLSSLSTIDLRANEIGGAIPTELLLASNLIELNLSTNQIVGAIPDALEGSPNLLTLDLSFNRLTGSIPASVGSAPSLRILKLDNNQLSGVIPEMNNVQFLGE